VVLGSFEQAVLMAIVRLQDEAYGRAILGGVEERLQRDMAPGAIHATLDRLEKKGLLACAP
jgi:predicted transcriptional regulator